MHIPIYLRQQKKIEVSAQRCLHIIFSISCNNKFIRMSKAIDKSCVLMYVVRVTSKKQHFKMLSGLVKAEDRRYVSSLLRYFDDLYPSSFSNANSIFSDCQLVLILQPTGKIPIGQARLGTAQRGAMPSSMGRPITGAVAGDGARPMTAVRAAGFSSK